MTIVELKCGFCDNTFWVPYWEWQEYREKICCPLTDVTDGDPCNEKVDTTGANMEVPEGTLA